MYALRVALLLALLPILALSAGCATDCDSFCTRQGRFIDRCLPQFDQEWSDVNADWKNKSDFVGACSEQVDERIEEDTEATCANAADGADRTNCENTVRQSVFDACAEDISKFEQSCTDYWRDATNFTPGVFDPPELPSGDDDDDSAGDDDDSAGDDDDSAGDDDDDSAIGDDDDSAVGDDDDSAR